MINKSIFNYLKYEETYLLRLIWKENIWKFQMIKINSTPI